LLIKVNDQPTACGRSGFSETGFRPQPISGLRRPAEQKFEAGRADRLLNRTTERNPADNAPSRPGGEKMLYYALVFFIIAVIAGLLGFGVIASAAAGIAKILFFVFLVLFIVTLIGHASRGRTV
jgi:uncharacterized membrane protein YtjA (UPF0391 family)